MIVLVGESGSGKSSIEKELLNRGYRKITSYTTRAPRTGEVEGIDYFFISKDTFSSLVSLKLFAEWVEYNGNSYGIAKSDCTVDRVAVVEPSGLQQLQSIEGLNICSFYINTPKQIRYERMKYRGDYEENVRNRIDLDEEVFKGIEAKVDFIVDNSGSLETTANIIESLIRGVNTL